MTDTIKEQLSAFLDGELPEAETTLLLKRLERDEELKGALSRYSLIGAALRSDGELSAARHVASRVSAALAQEPAFTGIAARRWLQPLAGLGVAASVAAAALLLLPQWQATTDGAAAVEMAMEAPAPQLLPVVAAIAERPLVAAEPAPSYTTPPAPLAGAALAPSQLASYLVAHSEFTSPLSRRTVIVAPLVPLAPLQRPASPEDAPQ